MAESGGDVAQPVDRLPLVVTPARVNQATVLPRVDRIDTDTIARTAQ